MSIQSGERELGCWGEVFFQVKNTFLLIKILRRCAYSRRIKFALIVAPLSPYLPISLSPHLPSNQILAGRKKQPCLLGGVRGGFLLPAPCSLLPAPCSLLPAPCSLLPAPCSLKTRNLYLTSRNKS
ncbi:hypothetical protein [Moorena producens]|uniref:hypothetical protein n=1 Tax=Moorena producens TaxID=1155739 RepID=UPI00143A8900|nr:hypothetical protein [Moorena producens]